jgi:Adenylate and Guanylate cyclase catalytic domain
MIGVRLIHLSQHLLLVRDPFQVFILLETLYGAYDYIAERRNIFKVETVGDCYIAGKYIREFVDSLVNGTFCMAHADGS